MKKKMKKKNIHKENLFFGLVIIVALILFVSISVPNFQNKITGNSISITGNVIGNACINYYYFGGAFQGCVDQDSQFGGKEEYLSSCITVDENVFETDECMNPIILTEYNCDGGSIGLEIVDCSALGTTCVDGRCVCTSNNNCPSGYDCVAGDCVKSDDLVLYYSLDTSIGAIYIDDLSGSGNVGSHNGLSFTPTTSQVGSAAQFNIFGGKNILM